MSPSTEGCYIDGDLCTGSPIGSLPYISNTSGHPIMWVPDTAQDLMGPGNHIETTYDHRYLPRLLTPLCIRPPARWRSKKKNIAIICVCSRSRRRLRRLGRLLTQIYAYAQI